MSGSLYVSVNDTEVPYKRGDFRSTKREENKEKISG